MEVTLVIKSQGLIGEKINIDLSDDKIDYEYQGEYLESDLIENFTVTEDVIKLPLKTIKQRK